jgi:hypothetical protein
VLFEGVVGEWRYSCKYSLTSALDGCEWSASRPGRFNPREGALGTHWIGGWVGPRDGLHSVSEIKGDFKLSASSLGKPPSFFRLVKVKVISFAALKGTRPTSTNVFN